MQLAGYIPLCPRILKQLAQQFRNGTVFIGSFPSGPQGQVFRHGDCYVLQHEISVTRKHGYCALSTGDNRLAGREVDFGNGENVEIEAIADAEKLPGRPPNEIYYDVQTNKGYIYIENLPQIKKLSETIPQAGVGLAKRSIRDFVEKLNAKQNLNLPPDPNAKPQPEEKK